MRMNTKKLKNKILLCLILIVIGVSLLLNDYVVAKREKVFSTTNLELTELLKEEKEAEAKKKEEQPKEEKKEEQQPQPQQPVTTNNNYETYAGILEIPKISFNKGFYQKESSLNNSFTGARSTSSLTNFAKFNFCFRYNMLIVFLLNIYLISGS